MEIQNDFKIIQQVAAKIDWTMSLITPCWTGWLTKKEHLIIKEAAANIVLRAIKRQPDCITKRNHQQKGVRIGKTEVSILLRCQQTNRAEKKLENLSETK